MSKRAVPWLFIRKRSYHFPCFLPLDMCNDVRKSWGGRERERMQFSLSVVLHHDYVVCCSVLVAVLLHEPHIWHKPLHYFISVGLFCPLCPQCLYCTTREIHSSLKSRYITCNRVVYLFLHTCLIFINDPTSNV